MSLDITQLIPEDCEELLHALPHVASMMAVVGRCLAASGLQCARVQFSGSVGPQAPALFELRKPPGAAVLTEAACDAFFDSLDQLGEDSAAAHGDDPSPDFEAGVYDHELFAHEGPVVDAEDEDAEDEDAWGPEEEEDDD